jgi:hypothetical protein
VGDQPKKKGLLSWFVQDAGDSELKKRQQAVEKRKRLMEQIGQ